MSALKSAWHSALPSSPASKMWRSGRIKTACTLFVSNHLVIVPSGSRRSFPSRATVPRNDGGYVPRRARYRYASLSGDRLWLCGVWVLCPRTRRRLENRTRPWGRHRSEWNCASLVHIRNWEIAQKWSSLCLQPRVVSYEPIPGCGIGGMAWAGN